MAELRFVSELREQGPLSQLSQLLSSADQLLSSADELTVSTIRAAEPLRAAVAVFFVAAVPFVEAGGGVMDPDVLKAYTDAADAVYRESAGTFACNLPAFVWSR